MSKREHLGRSDPLGGDLRPPMMRSASGWLDIFGSARSNGEDGSVRRELQGLELMEGQVKRSLEAMKLRRVGRGRGFSDVGAVFIDGFSTIETSTVRSDVERQGVQPDRPCVRLLLSRPGVDGEFASRFDISKQHLVSPAPRLQCLTSVFFPPLATSHISRAGHDDGSLPQDGKGNTNGDWISYSIALALSQLPTGVVDVKMWSRAISLLLTGLLILASLAQVLRSVARILKLTSKSIGAGFLLLGLSQLMVSAVVVLAARVTSADNDFDLA
jgi:hypothetical protein